MRSRVGTMLQGGAMLAVVIALGLVLISSSAVLATELTDGGTEVRIQGVDDTAATVWSWLKGFVINLVGAGIMLGGVGRAASGHFGQGAGIFGSGAVVPFIPGISTSGQEAVPGATFEWVSQASAHLWPSWPVPYDPVWLLALAISGAVVFVYGRRQKEVLR